MKALKITLALMAAGYLVSGCNSAADVASHNLSKAADSFEVTRRVSQLMRGIPDKGLHSLLADLKCLHQFV
jgi:hypothetical protein